jgi:hypothetical protein
MRSLLGVALSVVLGLSSAACAGRNAIDKGNAPAPAAAGQSNMPGSSAAGAPVDAAFDEPSSPPIIIVLDAAPAAEPGQGVCQVPPDIDTPDAGQVPGCAQEPVPENCPRKSCRSLCPPNSYAIACYGSPSPSAALGCALLRSDETTDRDDYCCPCL